MIRKFDDSLSNLAIRAALYGGIEILRIYASGSSEVWIKADKTPLTQADVNSQAAIHSILQISGLPMMSEESDAESFDVRKEWRRLWVVDPLDGTKEFVKRNGQFTVNIALVENHKTIFGLILAPVSGELFIGSMDDGSYKTQLPDNWLDRTVELLIPELDWIKLEGNCLSLEPILVVSSSHFTNETAHFVSRVKKHFGQVKTISAGSALKMCMVASGSAHVYPRFGATMEWDTAAGHAIIKGMGGNLLNYHTLDELTYNRADLVNPWFIALDDSDLSHQVLQMIQLKP